MKVSKKARYGLRALVDLAVHVQECPMPLAEIAKRQEMSLNYLEQVFSALRKAGIVKSMKGPKGGYSLEKEPEQITVEEILAAIEGKFCIVDKKEEKELDALQKAIRKLVWNQIDEDVIALLQDMTLAEIADKAMESGVDVNREM
ncbi:MAG: RrF2 family transcriptional regulator [Bariatricus sp.]